MSNLTPTAVSAAPDLAFVNFAELAERAMTSAEVTALMTHVYVQFVRAAKAVGLEQGPLTGRDTRELSGGHQAVCHVALDDPLSVGFDVDIRLSFEQRPARIELVLQVLAYGRNAPEHGGQFTEVCGDWPNGTDLRDLYDLVTTRCSAQLQTLNENTFKAVAEKLSVALMP